MLEQESSEQSKALIGRGADEMDLLKLCADLRGYVIPGGFLHTNRSVRASIRLPCKIT